MRQFLKITFFAIVTLVAFNACRGNEDEITPSGNYSPIRGGFPQGDSEYDKIINQIKEDFGVYLLYKDVTEEDMNRTWQSVGTGPVIVAGDAEDRDKGAWDLPLKHLPFYVDFFQNHIFPNISKEFAKTTLPVKIYMIHNLREEPRKLNDEEQEGEESEDNSADEGTDGVKNKNLHIGTFDNWVISFPEDVISGTDSEYTLRQQRCIFMTNVIKNSIAKGELVAPDGFWADYSMNRDANCINGSKHDGCDKVYINDKEGENGLYTLGYIDVLEEKFGTGRTTNVIKEITHPNGWLHSDYWTSKLNPTCDLFEAYIMNAMWFTPDEFKERYNTGKNTLIQEKYDLVVEYLLEKYGVDLVNIALAGQQE